MTKQRSTEPKKHPLQKVDTAKAALMFTDHQAGMNDSQVAAKHGVSRQTVSRVLQPLKEQAATLAMEQLGSKIKMLAAQWVDDYATDAAILEKLKNDALTALKQDDNKSQEDIKSLITGLKDTIWRLGSHRIGLVKALQPLGLTAEAGPLSGKYTPQGQLFQFFIKELNVVSGDVDKALVDKVEKMQQYLKNKEMGKKAVEADFEEIKNDS